MTDVLKVGIVGAGGYTGAELVRVVHAHPRLELAYVAARDNAGKRLGDVLPSTLGAPEIANQVLENFEPEAARALAGRLDVVFAGLPHGTSAAVCGALLDQGLQVVDLSADFRLKDLETYERTYGKHPRPELLERAVYGLAELHRAELAGARLIASPGCYPTSAILPLAPLLRAGLVEPRGMIVDSKSGVSGAGRKPGPATHFAESAEGIRPYKVAGRHRHTPEIEQELGLAAGAKLNVVFTPHLCPMTRGILTVAYARRKDGVSVEQCREAAQNAYTTPLVTVLEEGRLPDTLWVRGSACAQLAYEVDENNDMVLAMCAIDNLARGASVQAVQALNVSRGWNDGLGLPVLGQFP
jgi:N-acetyl-gamma-glutamyl-phosphate reductase